MNDLDFMVSSEKESRYLSLEDFEKKDKESQKKVKKATSTENDSTKYLYSMPPNMKRNDYYRAEMTPNAFCGGDETNITNHIDAAKKALDSWRDQLEKESWYKQVSTGEALWRKYPVIHHKEEPEEIMGIDDFEEENEEIEKRKNQRINYLAENPNINEEDLKDQFDKKTLTIKKTIKSLKKRLKNPNYQDIKEEYSTTMKNFNDTIKNLDISETFGLDAVEENLEKAMELAEEEKSEGMIAPSDIKKLLSTFRNLRKTQLDNITQNIPSGLDKERRRALITVYETDFWELYEMKVREVLRKYDSKKGKLKQEEGLKFRINKLVDKIKGKIYGSLEDESFDNEKKVEEIIAHLDLNELFDETKNKPKGIADFEPKNQVYDLIAATLRPKDNSDDGRAEWNTYSSYYNNLRDIMDEYMEDDDDYWSSNSKEKDNKTITKLFLYEDDSKKELNHTTAKFTYTLYAILMYCADKPNDESKYILKRGSCNDMYDKKLFDHNVSQGGEKIFTNGYFKEVYDDLKNFCVNLEKTQYASEIDIKKLLEKFSDIKGISKIGELFHDLCTHNGIEMSESKYRIRFEKLLNSKDNVKSTDQPQKQSKANQDNA